MNHTLTKKKKDNETTTQEEKIHFILFLDECESEQEQWRQKSEG